MMVGKPAPLFSLPDQDGKEVTLEEFQGQKNVVLIFYPLDWTPVWSSELPACEGLRPELEKLDTQVLGISIDSSPSHKAFAEKLDVRFPLLSDMHRHVSRLYNVLIEEQGIAARATFIIDKKGTLRHMVVNDLDMPRNQDELVRLVQHLEKE